MLRKACRSAAIAPDEVGYVEAHGTGTPVGDPIEAEAIATVFGERSSDQPSCLFGSIKTNIGHLEPASGIAGLIKAALCVERGQIPPSINFQTINPNIRLDDRRVDVCRRLVDFPRNNGARISTVNSFGFGGTNACAVLQEAPYPPPRPAKPKQNGYPVLLPISAQSASSLQQNAARIAAGLDREEWPLADLAGTLSLRRTHLTRRAAVIATDFADAAAKLRILADGDTDADVITGRRGADPRNIFVFTGQGAQWWAMGRGLLKDDPDFRASMEECDRLFRAISGWSLMDQFTCGREASRIEQTDVAQPATFALQISLAARWKAWGVRPEAVIGHSIGEIAAAYVAEALSLEDAISIVYHRSRLQERSRFRGGMAALGLRPDEVRRLFHEHQFALEIAAINGPALVTVGGDRDEIDRFLEFMQARGDVFVRRLQVDYAFHTRQMAPYEEELRLSLASIEPGPTRIPMYSTVTGNVVNGEALDANYWWRNMRDPVQFLTAVNAATDDGFNTFLELGAHPTLVAPVRDCLTQRESIATVVASLHRDVPDAASMARALGQLYAAGASVNWASVVPTDWHFVDLPPQPFNKTSLWAEAEIALGPPRRTRSSPSRQAGKGRRPALAGVCQPRHAAFSRRSPHRR